MKEFALGVCGGIFGSVVVLPALRLVGLLLFWAANNTRYRNGG